MPFDVGEDLVYGCSRLGRPLYSPHQPLCKEADSENGPTILELVLDDIGKILGWSSGVEEGLSKRHDVLTHAAIEIPHAIYSFHTDPHTPESVPSSIINMHCPTTLRPTMQPGKQPVTTG